MAARNDKPIALITGGSSGIGAASVLELARKGFDVAVNFRQDSDGADRASEAAQSAGAKTLLIQGDVSEDEDCKRIIGTVTETFGRLDVLVNNAGTTKFVGGRNLDGLTRDDFEHLTAVNVASVYQMVRAARSALEDSPIASVINISSQSGISGIGSSTAYAASKGALNTLTLSLARALAPKIRVNAICPGFVDTPWHEKAPQMTEERLGAFREKMAETAPLKRLTTAEDIAETVTWLACGGRAITGHLLSVDGGTHLTVGSPF